MKHITDKSFKEIQNIFYVQLCFFFSKKRAVCEIMWKNGVVRDRPHMIIRCMRTACWITKATNTRSQNTDCFPTATVVARTRLKVTLYVRGLFC